MSRPFSYNDENFTVIGNIITNVDITETSYPPRLVYAWFLLKDI